jgi:hypothetical protein
MEVQIPKPVTGHSSLLGMSTVLFACLTLINDLYCDVHFTIDEC